MKAMKFLASTLGLLALVGVGLAQDNLALRYLGDNQRLLCPGCYTVHNIVSGSLYDQETTTVTITVRDARQYTILGSCDDDCGDLDFSLYDPAGRLIASDLASDDSPSIRAWLIPGVRYRLEVLMASCLLEPCAYAMGVYRR